MNICIITASRRLLDVHEGTESRSATNAIGVTLPRPRTPGRYADLVVIATVPQCGVVLDTILLCYGARGGAQGDGFAGILVSEVLCMCVLRSLGSC